MRSPTTRWAVLHRTQPRWEAGEAPDRELIGRVGAFLGELGQRGALLGAEGLRASSLGIRLRFAGGARTILPGPFPGENELPTAFEIVRVPTLEEAAEWATRVAVLLGDGEVDVRPVTEPWDIGLAPRPASVDGGRYMLLYKATRATEAGRRKSARTRAGLARLRHEMRQAGVLLTGENLRPSSEGRRLQRTAGRVTATDGPFTESKELIAGYVLVRASSLDEATALARRYLEIVQSDGVDVRGLEEPTSHRTAT